MKAEELERDIAIHYDDGIAMNDHEGVIECRSRGTIVLTAHLSGVVLRRSPAAP